MKTHFKHLFITMTTILFVSCSSDTETKQTTTTARATTAPRLSIDNQTNYKLKFKLSAYGSLTHTSFAANYELVQDETLLPTTRVLLTDFKSTETQAIAEHKYWDVYRNGSYIESKEDGDKANDDYGAFVNGVDNTDGYFTKWHWMDGFITDGINRAELFVFIDSLTGETLGGNPSTFVFTDALGVDHTIQIQHTLLANSDVNVIINEVP